MCTKILLAPPSKNHSVTEKINQYNSSNHIYITLHQYSHGVLYFHYIATSDTSSMQDVPA
jgi:hypothetical protein